ncbi:hypothetical protein E2C01_021599 [Portunus trituberculatus]|uniref:Uncharacterized protein n=1 Tax=Portunus trituberculatus TaxID=210409 RepID=A0A5B7E4T2_PORTR|nr:hypothetical protein [Portunus trituberculatus]
MYEEGVILSGRGGGVDWVKQAEEGTDYSTGGRRREKFGNGAVVRRVQGVGKAGRKASRQGGVHWEGGERLIRQGGVWCARVGGVKEEGMVRTWCGDGVKEESKTEKGCETSSKREELCRGRCLRQG